MTDEQVTATLYAIIGAVLDSVRDAGADGVPESLVHLALMQTGASTDQAQVLIAGLIETNLVSRDKHHRLFATSELRDRPSPARAERTRT